MHIEQNSAHKLIEEMPLPCVFIADLKLILPAVATR